MSRGTSGSASWMYCHQCNMFDYPQEDKSTMHGDHTVYKFQTATKYIPPIRLVLMKLDTDIEITHNELVIFRLALALHGDNPADWLEK